MIKHLLIPIDFSDCSINALKYAIQLSLSMANTPAITILNAYTMPVVNDDLNINFGPGAEQKEVEAQLRQAFKAIGKKIPALTKIKHEMVFRKAPVKSAVADFCKEAPIDLIVMGSLGASGVDEVVLGSNAHRVIQSKVAPVLMIPANYSYTPIKNIGLSNDYKGISNEALTTLKDLQLTNQSNLHLLHISKEPLLDMQRSAEAKNIAVHLRELPHQFHFLNEVNVASGIHHFIEQEEIDLLAIIPRKKGLFQQLFGRSESKSLIFHSKIPLLALIED